MATSDVTEQLEKQFLPKELRIGKRSQEFPTWTGLVSSAVSKIPAPSMSEIAKAGKAEVSLAAGEQAAGALEIGATVRAHSLQSLGHLSPPPFPDPLYSPESNWMVGARGRVLT